jgi:hypothetical protein
MVHYDERMFIRVHYLSFPCVLIMEENPRLPTNCSVVISTQTCRWTGGSSQLALSSRGCSIRVRARSVWLSAGPIMRCAKVCRVLLRETRLDRSNQKKNSSEQHELRCQAPDALDLETLKKIVFFGQGHGVGKASLEEGVFEAPNIFYECSKNDFHACFR